MKASDNLAFKSRALDAIVEIGTSTEHVRAAMEWQDDRKATPAMRSGEVVANLGSALEAISCARDHLDQLTAEIEAVIEREKEARR